MIADADVIIIGAGIAGLAAAGRLQARGVKTLVLEAHGQVGGCAGFFRKGGFSFDVGATTLVDFEAGGVGGQLLAELGLPPVAGEALPGYRAWLPDRTVTLHRDPAAWHAERLAAFGDTPQHRRFWRLLDHLAETFWAVSRKGVRLPLRSPADVARAARMLPPRHWPLARYLNWTVGDALRRCGVADDRALRGLLGMLLQDTVQASVEEAPLINGALGITIRGAGLTRPAGGMRGFWQSFVARFRELGGTLRVGRKVLGVSLVPGGFAVQTRRETFHAPRLVSTLPIWDTARLGLPAVERTLRPYLRRDEERLGGAIVVFLGVPESEVSGQTFTHHQLLVDYDRPLGDGNNMFVSVSAPGDLASAPAGWRAVMISTQCDLRDWEDLPPDAYLARKIASGQRLIGYARNVYPDLGRGARVHETGTPRTYAAYTHRYRGAVGGIGLHLGNSNQRAVPYDLGVPGFWQAGDTTWPGLGTVACVLGSRHIADAVAADCRRARAGRRPHPTTPERFVLPGARGTTYPSEVSHDYVA